MAGVNGSIQLTADLSFSAANIGQSSRVENIEVSKIIQFTAGNGALGLADVCYHGVRTLGISANEDLDMRGLLLDPFGATVNNAEIMAIIIAADAANTNNVVVKPATTNGFLGPFGAAANTYTIEPGCWLNMNSVRGWAVTAGTGDLLNVANGGAGTPITYEILVIGRSIVG